MTVRKCLSVCLSVALSWFWMCCKIFKKHPRSLCQPASQAQTLLFIWVIYSFLAAYLNTLLTHCARPTDNSVLVRPLKASDKNLQCRNLVIEHIHTFFCQSKDSLGHWTWLWLWWSPDPLSGATMRFTFLVCLENNKCPFFLKHTLRLNPNIHPLDLRTETLQTSVVHTVHVYCHDVKPETVQDCRAM